VNDEQGVALIADTLLRRMQHSSKADAKADALRLAAARLFSQYCQQTKVRSLTCRTSHVCIQTPLSALASMLITGCVRLYGTANTPDLVVQAAVDGMSALVRTLDARQQLDQLANVRAVVEAMKRDMDDDQSATAQIAGLQTSAGAGPVVGMLRESLLAGNAEQKEVAARTLTTVIQWASVDALRPFVVSVTGPLIRVLGDRFVLRKLVAGMIGHCCAQISRWRQGGNSTSINAATGKMCLTTPSIPAAAGQHIFARTTRTDQCTGRHC
jgi:hypothetical protein